MNCPKCKASMESVTIEDLQVDRCTGCKGLWFDALVLRQLAKKKGVDVIDTGDPAVGQEKNKIGNIDCPVCHTRMIRMVDMDQPHIWYESCKVCQGAFFDAGEFKDLNHNTIKDFFRDLFVKERK